MGREDQDITQPYNPDDDGVDGQNNQQSYKLLTLRMRLSTRLHKSFAMLKSYIEKIITHVKQWIMPKKMKQRKKTDIPTSKQNASTWTRNITLTESLLAILIAVIALTQITIWLTSMGRLYIDQSRVEMINQLVNQTYRVLHEETTVNQVTPLCIQRGISQLSYVKCDDQTLVAVDEFGTGTQDSPGSNLLILRRFYGNNGTNVLGIDRYEYSNVSILVQKTRVIFRKMFGVFSCAYLVNAYEPTGVSIKTEFHGSCGSDLAEIPTQSFFMRSPPPITLFMPYR